MRLKFLLSVLLAIPAATRPGMAGTITGKRPGSGFFLSKESCASVFVMQVTYDRDRSHGVASVAGVNKRRGAL